MVQSDAEFVFGVSVLMTILAIACILFFIRLHRMVVKKNKEISIKDDVIEIQKEIIEQQPRIFSRNHDN